MAATRTINPRRATTTFLPVLHFGFPLRRTRDFDFPLEASMRAPSERNPDSLATDPVSDPPRIWRPSAANPS